jgi:hypothetical protein
MFNKPLITLDYFIGGPSRPSKQPSIYELIGGSPGTPIIAICQQSLATLLLCYVVRRSYAAGTPTS